MKLDVRELSPNEAVLPLEFELFASDEQLATLEEQYALAPQQPALALAWALRQRDPERALGLARSLAGDAMSQPRLCLIEGERALAHERIEEAQSWCRRALQAFEAAQDSIGICDAQLLFGAIASELNQRPAASAAEEAALSAAQRAAEPFRCAFLMISLARRDMVAQGLAREDHWNALLPAVADSPAVASALVEYRAAVCTRRRENLQAAAAYADAFALSLRCGQGCSAARQAHNAALMSSTNNDPGNALVWAQHSLDVARRVWPAMVGHGLVRCCSALRELGQLKEAREMITEALELAKRQPDSAINFLAVDELASVELACGNCEAAVNLFSAALASPRIWPAKQVEIIQQRSAALLKLGRLDEADDAVAEGLSFDPAVFMGAMRLHMRAAQADIWLAKGKPQAAVQAYAQILSEAANLTEVVIVAELLEGAAAARAAVGDFAEAYALSRRAIDSHVRRHSGEAEQRARAVYTQRRVERVQLEAEHQRRLAQAAADRLAVLEKLGDTGRELTAELNAQRALALLEQAIHSLLQLQDLSVHLLDVASERLICELGLDARQSVPMNDAACAISRCARERQLLVLDAGSAMYAPLEVGTRLVGVVAVHGQAAAYGTEQQLVFKTLCAYLAVALENARAYAQLQQVQRHVQAQERMAALGSMVAGVAHELNTPIGNALMSSGALGLSLREFETSLAGGGLRRSDWQLFAAQLREGLGLVERGVQSAAQLISNFKQVAQDRSLQHKSRFKLRELCDMLLLQWRAELEPAGHVLQIDIDAELDMDSYAGSLAQALGVLVRNAVRHGLSDARPGRIGIGAQLLPLGRVALSVQDDGPGMTPSVLARVFEPFFTTTFGRGGNGLGLSICHNIVEDVLGGRIEAFSEMGEGSRFVMELPLTAP